MKTIAVLKTLLAAFRGTQSGSPVAYSPASVLCDRMLNDIGQHQFRELREATTALSRRSDRFPL
ncbi:hypothetical protein [Ruegeria arenilitoris]|uniref:hypothetical protein n=1 Tax=Ruegeria arenilitoris TaxID=1173585 RepID=UPI0014813E2A|nr:hypothetical protein [Ruegeria arenilitoris]